MDFLRSVEKGKEYWVSRPAIRISRNETIFEVVKFKLVDFRWEHDCSIVADTEINGIKTVYTDRGYFYDWDRHFSKEDALHFTKKHNTRILEKREKEFNNLKESILKYI